MRVLLTGGAGLVGSHVAVALTDAGHDVSCLDSLHSAAYRAAMIPISVRSLATMYVAGDSRRWADLTGSSVPRRCCLLADTVDG
jgi:nucleoside-diphosphate-sugar epimerase